MRILAVFAVLLCSAMVPQEVRRSARPAAHYEFATPRFAEAFLGGAQRVRQMC